ncbi:glycosyltransferase family 4 protein [Candidatus Pelagibacter sp.]|nr:glycosyltransferase family 4 protein [Candidatus Pelagibacter sp.]
MKLIKIAYVINHLSFFKSHILPIAKKAKKKGFEIRVFCGIGGSQLMEKEALKYIRASGIKFTKYKFQPGMTNIFLEPKYIVNIITDLKKYEPNIVHCISLKGVLYGSLYSIIYKPKKLISFITGMGYFFTNKLNAYEKFVRFCLLKVIKFALVINNSILVLENKDDFKFFEKKVGFNKKQITLVKGAGVDLKKFYYDEKLKIKSILFPARVLIEKGIFEYLSAAEALSKKFYNWQFLIAGTLDYKKNKKSTNPLNFNRFYNNKNIKFLGHRKDMNILFNKCSIVCLPSYREGFPKSLIEASSSGCAIITTNVTGCRDVIKKNFNGLLSKPRNTDDLKNKLEKVISNQSLRLKFSKNSRQKALKDFGIDKFINKNLELYKI